MSSGNMGPTAGFARGDRGYGSSLSADGAEARRIAPPRPLVPTLTPCGPKAAGLGPRRDPRPLRVAKRAPQVAPQPAMGHI
jgi:hypothetical protein